MQEMQETWARSPGWEDPLEKEINPLQYSCLENPRDRGAWQAIVHGVLRVRVGNDLATEHASSKVSVCQVSVQKTPNYISIYQQQREIK